MNNQTIFNISPWNILGDMLGDHPFNGMFRTMANRVEGRFPPVNCYSSEKSVVLDIEMPGRKPSDVEVHLEPQAVIIEGSATGNGCTKPYKRRFELDFPIASEKATATFRNGILRVELPKAEQAVPKRIEIGIADSIGSTQQ